MTEIEITGASIPRLSRRELAGFIRKVVKAIERADAAPFTPTGVSIAFIGDARMKKLNRQYRRKNRTTDILTFGAEPDDADQPRHLGELIISLDQARRQAREEGHSLATEIRYLVLHGIIHAFGYDHETDRGQMNALELELRRDLGLE